MFGKRKLGKIPKQTLIVMVPTAFYTLAFFAFFVYGQHRPEPFWFRLGFFSTYVSVGMALWVLVAKKTPSNKNFRYLANWVTLALFVANATLLWGTWHGLLEHVRGYWFRSLVALIFSFISEYRRETRRTHPTGPAGDSLIVQLE
jgi:hypothetical protein